MKKFTTTSKSSFLPFASKGLRLRDERRGDRRRRPPLQPSLPPERAIVTSGVIVPASRCSSSWAFVSNKVAKGSLRILLQDAAAVHGVPVFQEIVIALAFRFLAPIAISSRERMRKAAAMQGLCY
uniref:Uncharacterized protein n=1 Tax=Oryza meridionalis TaxID=40149 RepID=A0A0E0DUF3_9ORYZ